MLEIRKRDNRNHVLTVRENLFCKHYLITLNAKEAAILAGFSKKTAHVLGARLLKKPKVRKKIRATLLSLERRLDITIDKKIDLLWKTALRCYGLTDEEAEKLKRGEKVHAIFDFDANAMVNVVAEINKMQGHYAPTKTINLNAEASAEKVDEYIEKYERDC